MPGGREALLNPESDHLAIGTFGSPAQGFVGVLFTTYATFDLGDTQSHAEEVHQRLAKLRAQKGLERADRLPKLEADLSAIVATVSSGELNANQGLERVLSVAAERARSEVRAYYVDTYGYRGALSPLCDEQQARAGPLPCTAGLPELSAMLVIRSSRPTRPMESFQNSASSSLTSRRASSGEVRSTC